MQSTKVKDGDCSMCLSNRYQKKFRRMLVHELRAYKTCSDDCFLISWYYRTQLLWFSAESPLINLETCTINSRINCLRRCRVGKIKSSQPILICHSHAADPSCCIMLDTFEFVRKVCLVQIPNRTVMVAP